MEFWDEEDSKSTSFASCLQKRFHLNEIWLVIKHPATTASIGALLALELGALSPNFQCPDVTSLLQYHTHAFENPCTFMAVWIIQALGCAISKLTIHHTDLLLQHCTILPMYGLAVNINHGSLDTPICWFLPISPVFPIPLVTMLRRELGHFLGGKCVIGPLEVSCGIVIYKPVLIVRIML